MVAFAVLLWAVILVQGIVIMDFYINGRKDAAMLRDLEHRVDELEKSAELTSLWSANHDHITHAKSGQ